MMAKRRIASLGTAGLILAGLLPSAVLAGTAQQITDFGSNPSGIDMYLYTPSNLASKPAILVGPHACHGKATDVCQSGNAFAQQADKYGFLLVCPGAKSSDGCWDVHSAAVLTHDGGGDASSIISMVKWVVENRNGDPDRVFVAGHSSGGMMTNVLVGSYPDVFKAGAAFAGVPFACYAQGEVDSLGWNSSCATGKVTMSGQQWGDLVRASYPGFTGTRPRMQLWHGTNDDVLYFQNFTEEIKQWANVFGLSETPTSTEQDALQSTWIRTRYADSDGLVWLEAIQETGQPHNLIVDAAEAIHFFGLDGSSPVPDAGTKDAPASDGATGSGGAGAGTGGRSGTGGESGSGGRAGTGGATGRDAGNRDAIATGTGGAGSGGVAGTGTGSGGRGSGGRGSGGSEGTGGAGSGGVAGTGAGSGGTGTGGAVGGNTGAGGSTPSGSGGSIAESGGTTGQTEPPAKSSGCSCDIGARKRVAPSAWWMIVVGLGLRRKCRGHRGLRRAQK
jgi:acetylxylan esterase